jgi:hypothetical protein
MVATFGKEELNDNPSSLVDRLEELEESQQWRQSRKKPDPSGVEDLNMGYEGEVFLEGTPSHPSEQVALMEWMTGLVASFGMSGAIDAIDHYESMGWISSDVRSWFIEVISLLDLESPEYDHHMDVRGLEYTENHPSDDVSPGDSVSSVVETYEVALEIFQECSSCSRPKSGTSPGSTTGDRQGTPVSAGLSGVAEFDGPSEGEQSDAGSQQSFEDSDNLSEDAEEFAPPEDVVNSLEEPAESGEQSETQSTVTEEIDAEDAMEEAITGELSTSNTNPFEES